jgi:hypothetical protein
MVIPVILPSYSGGRDQENCGSKATRTKSKQDPISTNMPGKVVHTCDPSYVVGKSRRAMVQASLRKTTRLYQKITKAKGLGT